MFLSFVDGLVMSRCSAGALLMPMDGEGNEADGDEIEDARE